MMAKNRENRYRNPDDLLIDFKCLLQGERPMIASAKAESLASLAEGEVTEEEIHSGIPESEMMKLAALVNSRNNILAALSVLLGLSVVTNLVFLLMK